MPRRQFVSDLRQACQGPLPDLIKDLRQSEDDGQFEFSLELHSPNGPTTHETINVLVPELSDYPSTHEYMIIATDEAPVHITTALQEIRRTKGKAISEVLGIISKKIRSVQLDRDGDVAMPDSQWDESDGEAQASEDEGDDIYSDDHDAFELDPGPRPPTNPSALASSSAKARPIDRALRARIRDDLRVAKAEGFKIGTLGHLLEGHNAFVTVSIRMSKLGISEEAMEAWNVDPSEFLILIIQYPNGYKTNEVLQGIDSAHLATNLGMRVVAGKNYKPTLQEAIDAFTVAKKTDQTSHIDGASKSNGTPDSIKETFISKPLIGLLQERLLPLLAMRGLGMSWHGAEETYQSRLKAARGVKPPDHYATEPPNNTLPRIVNADHYNTKRSHYSFPLLAMQFLLRHFVRCTEFCLVCHRKLDTEVEAIKPYVCDSSLCLYQYMTLGFGPSIEHEILSQPYVVDLLVSFLYNTASNRKLTDLPDGLSIMLPPTVPTAYRTFSKPSIEESAAALSSTYDVTFDIQKREVVFLKQDMRCPVRRGDWIVLLQQNQVEKTEFHCYVEDALYFPNVRVAAPIVLSPYVDSAKVFDNAANKPKSGLEQKATVEDKPSSNPVESVLRVYNVDFDQLREEEKTFSICRMLDTLPTVTEMREYLLQPGHKDLKRWVERISPSALTLLRWCIASNRACIMQTDGDSSADTTTTPTKKRERLSGMKDFMQFRFAMGAPDKEQRFIREVRNTAKRTRTKYPTIFAWHGSPLHNWHMIIREGLHYNKISHGRAYGNGVYHARDASISTGYSGMHGGYGYGGGNDMPHNWTNSVLRISTALALNEIVNAPSEFISSNPYFVVQHLDWIQTRYLFVQVRPTIEFLTLSRDETPTESFEQDPTHIPRGTSGRIVIPATAIKSRVGLQNERPVLAASEMRPAKKTKKSNDFDDPFTWAIKDEYRADLNLPTTPGSSAAASPGYDDDDLESVVTNASDREVLNGEDPEPEPLNNSKPSSSASTGLTTDFEPGTLDFAHLPLMPTPSYAVSATTRRLMKDLQAVRKIQESTPAAELGWFIDAEKLENVYQWIVELHSFHTFTIRNKPLPLVTDMASAGLKSIVLEIRFNKDFPYSPPYVRVVRPRFKTFNQGGGGHIVAGGAMCMELLTNTGWSSVSSMESVLMQIRMAIASEPFARLELTGGGPALQRGTAPARDYGTGEAADGYIRACQTHGWEVPGGFREMAYGLPSSAPAAAAGQGFPVGGIRRAA